MQLNLVHHPASGPGVPPFTVWATIDHVASLSDVATTNIWFGVSAPVSRFVIPELSEPARTDELWQTTCFEAFLRGEDTEGYREWNFSPSTQWAAYDFSAYRERASYPDVNAPYIRVEDNFTWWALGATITTDADTKWQLGLGAVLEETDGTKSYWALAHPSEKPDFHHPDCFVGKLA